MRPRGIRLIGALALTTMVLCACSVREPERESLESAIPAAFLASDLGISGAEAGTSVDGFAVSVWASAEFDTVSVTADDLREMLRLAVDNIDLSSVDTLQIIATVGPFQNDVSIDLGALGVELGFTDDSDLPSFTADWDDIVAFLEE
jgi:hypothetical protein